MMVRVRALLGPFCIHIDLISLARPLKRQAALLAEQHRLKVVLMDPKLEQRWIPNYGVWLEEWQGKSVRRWVGGLSA